jgi:CRP/FNR family transcriptional regulator, cyclic AMP receptor protein
MSSLIPDAPALERRLARLPVVKHPAGETVLTAGSKTGRLLFLRSGAVGVVKDGEKIANVSAPGSVFGEQAALLDQPHTADVRRSNRRPLRSGDPRATTRCRQPVTDRS